MSFLRLILLLLSVGSSGCGSPEFSARVSLPEHDLSVEVALRHEHLFLAEYSRSLVIRRASIVVASADLAFDTGGYSRVNLYRVDEAQLAIGTFGDHVYLFDAQRSVLQTVPSSSRNPLVGAEFLGAFDWFPRDSWRFVPASERAEIPAGSSSAMKPGPERTRSSQLQRTKLE